MSQDAPQQGPPSTDPTVAPPAPPMSLGSVVRQLLPAAVLGTGAALTSPIRSSPLIAGRALLGAYEGYKSAQPTEKDLYYQERLSALQMADRAQRIRMSNAAGYRDTLSDEDKLDFDLDPKAFRLTKTLETQRPYMVSHTSKVLGLDPEYLNNVPIQNLAKYDAYAAEHGAGTKVKRLNPDGTAEWMFINPHTGQDLFTGGPAPMPKKGEPKTPSPVAARAEYGAQLEDQGLPRDQWPKSVAAAYDKQFGRKAPGEAKLVPTGAAAMRQAYDNRLMATGSMDKDEKERLRSMTFEQYVRDTRKQAEQAMAPAAPPPAPSTERSGAYQGNLDASGKVPTAKASTAPTPTGNLPPTNLFPGVTVGEKDQIYTDGKTVYRVKPGDTAPTPDQMKELNLTRVR